MHHTSPWRLIAATVLIAAVTAGCTVPDVVITSSPTEDPTDEDVVAAPYSVDDIQSVDMVGTKTVSASSDSPIMCVTWHVQLTAIDPSSSAAGTAWHSNGKCMDDDSDPATEPSAVQIPLTEKQVSDFRAAIDKTGLTTWNAWLDENDQANGSPVDGATVYSVAIFINNQYGMYYDAFSVIDVFPPGWQAFVEEMSKVAGNPLK